MRLSVGLPSVCGAGTGPELASRATAALQCMESRSVVVVEGASAKLIVGHAVLGLLVDLAGFLACGRVNVRRLFLALVV